MNIKLILALLLWQCFTFPAVFNGLIESGVSKNNFLCPNNSSSSIVCKNSSTNAQGFNFSSNKVLQIFNDQAFWLHEQAERAKYLSTVGSYSGSDLESKMSSEGWGAMGSYCIIISTDPILTSIVMPNMKAKNGETKVVVQLWYNGDTTLQLWSQDAKILPENATFTVAVSNNTDPLPGVTTGSSATSGSLSEKFLEELHLQQNSRKESVYQAATQSPRSVIIQ